MIHGLPLSLKSSGCFVDAEVSEAANGDITKLVAAKGPVFGAVHHDFPQDQAEALGGRIDVSSAGFFPNRQEDSTAPVATGHPTGGLYLATIDETVEFVSDVLHFPGGETFGPDIELLPVRYSGDFLKAVE